MVREDSMDKLAGSDVLYKLRQRRPNMMDTDTSQGIAARFHANRLGQVMYRVHHATSAADRLLIGSPTPSVPHLHCWAGAGQSALTWMQCRHSLCRVWNKPVNVYRGKRSLRNATQSKQHLKLSHSPLCRCLCVRAYGADLPFQVQLHGMCGIVLAASSMCMDSL